MSITRNSHNPFKKYGHVFVRSVLHFFHNMYQKIMIMDIYERVFIIWLLVIFFLVIVSPIMILSPNNDTSFSTQYIFLIGKVQLMKTSLVILIGLSLTLTWHLSTRMRSYIIEYIWFNNNRYLFSFFLLFAALASLMSLGEMNNLLMDYTTMLRMHTMYYIVQILLIVTVWYCIYMIIYQWQWWFKGTIVWHNQRHSSQKEEDMQWLFDNLKDT